MKVHTQNILYSVILFMVCTFFYFMRPSYPLNTHGIFLPTTAQKYQPIPINSVSMFKTPPMKYQEIGHIRAQIHYNTKTVQAVQKLMKKTIHFIQYSAAQHGANGIIITRAGETPGPSPIDSILIEAKAIQT